MLELNRSSINAANNASQFDAGDVLAREAEHVYARGVATIEAACKDPNEKQKEIIACRLDDWKTLVEKAYNDIISRRASWVPWTVSGPANYPAKKMNAAADRQMQAASDWNCKMNRYINNTLEMLRDAIPQAQMLDEYRSGERRDAIPGDDPLALEKLRARLEGMKERHEMMKQRNAYWRKHHTMKGCPGVTDEEAEKQDKSILSERSIWQVPFPHYCLSNGNAEMKRIEERINAITRQRENGDAETVYGGFTVQQSATAGRINIIFDDKPGDDARAVLKSNGFHWSPRAKVWTRQLTDNAARAVRVYVVPGLLALDEYSEQEQEPAQEPEPAQDPAQEEEPSAVMTLQEFIDAASAAR